MMAGSGTSAVVFPLALGAASIISSIIGTFFVSTRDGGKIMNALYRGVFVSGLISAVAFYFITKSFFPEQLGSLFGCALIGLGLTAAMIVITEYYTATEYSPGAQDRRGLADRPCDQHDRRPRRVDEVDRPACPRGVPGHLRRRTRWAGSMASPLLPLRCSR